jgi:hypothetical protein
VGAARRRTPPASCVACRRASLAGRRARAYPPPMRTVIGRRLIEVDVG